MPRSLIKDSARARRRILFGDETRRTCLTEVSKRTGIPFSSLQQYKRGVSDIPLARVVAIANAIGLTDEQKLALFTTEV